MDPFQAQAYVPFWTGLIVMISLHNTGVSFILYRSRQTNISNILKIIFNLGNALRFGALASSFMTPKDVVFSQCAAIQYILMIGNVLFRVSLAAFLLWRLRQIQNDAKDKWICLSLFVARVAVVIPMFSSQRPSITYDPLADVSFCQLFDATARPFSITGIVVEFLIDIYVSVRLLQILHKANRNAASITTTAARSKRTLFTAVIYWNFLRLFVASLSSTLAVVDQFRILFFTETTSITIKASVNILLSYVVTVDAEIVRVIEGKDAKKGSSAGTEKSFKSTSHSPRSPRTPYSGNSLPKYSHNTSFSETQSQIDDDKIAIVSMKRLSFFEWANVVVGNRLRRGNEEDDDDEIQDEIKEEIIIDAPSKSDTEEIIDIPSKSNAEEIIDIPSKSDTEEIINDSSSKPDKEDDLEKGPQNRRSSTFSGTTETSTLDGNLDIVVEKN